MLLNQLVFTMTIPTASISCSFDMEVEDGEGAAWGSVMSRKKRRRRRRGAKRQLTVIIVMFNQTPAIKLINTLFPV